MSYCLNPGCQKPENPPGHKFCQSCGTKLLLRERYRAIAPIASGGMGRTFLAEDCDRLDSHCAIKQFLPLPQIQENPETMAKATDLFKQEARQLLQLGEHPQIPALYAYFEQEKRLYLVQQLIQGQDLERELQQNDAFGEEQIWQLLTDLLPVLQFIHDAGVIHRDIKPTNIIRRHGDDRMVLIDFGVAKQLSGNRLAITGTQIGTQGYAPMEQLRFGKAYPASDLYSLGVTCIQLLTGAELDELFDLLDFCWVWRGYLGKRGKTVSDRLAAAIDKMLCDRVNQRYQSAAEVMADLDIQVSPMRLAVVSAGTPNANRPIKAHNWRCVNTLKGHNSAIWSLAFSPDGKAIASGSDDKTVRVWQIEDGKLLHTLTDHDNPVYAVAISPDGKTLVSGSLDKTLKLWQLSNGKLLHTAIDYSNAVYCLAISPDGKIIVNGSRDKTIKVWYPNGKLIRTLSGHTEAVLSVAISPDGNTLVSGSRDNTIKLWKIGDGSLITTLEGHTSAVYSVAISSDGNTLVSGSEDNTIKLWNISDGEEIATFAEHSSVVYAVAISLDGNTLVSGSEDRTIKLWQMSDGKVLQTLTGHADWVWCLAISPDGGTIVSGSTDETIKIWQR